MTDPDDFAEFKAWFLEATLLGMKPNEAAMMMQRADNPQHAATLFRLICDGFRCDAIAAHEAKRARQIPSAVRAAVKEKSGGACEYCGETEGEFHIDHVIPVVAGGSGTLDNLAYACSSCNLSKGGRTPEQWKVARNG